MNNLDFLRMRLATASKYVRKRDALYKRHEKEIIACRSLGRQDSDTDLSDLILKNQLIVSEMIMCAEPSKVSREQKNRITRAYNSGDPGNLRHPFLQVLAICKTNLLSNSVRNFENCISRCYFDNPDTGQKEFEVWVFEALDRYSVIFELHISLCNEYGLEGFIDLMNPAE